MMKTTKVLILTLAASLGIQNAEAEAPSGYYTSCEGRAGQSLLTALSGVVGNHTTISYSGLWDLYGTTDVRSNGTIWDMYSTKQFTYRKDQCGSYSSVGDCYNREHSFPKSWFNDASPMVSDAFHIYPTDGKVNGQRSNYPYGECAGGTTLPAPSGIKALGRLGTSTFPGYTGKVFEPDDEYKGDFARSYFYMAAAYNSRISTFKCDMLAGNNYPVFTTWAINLLLKWHRQDPVSQKEIDRNDAVYAKQRNRNPFIDHPELVEYIWGDRQGQNWHPGGSSTPTLNRPVDGSTIDLGSTVVGYPRTATVNIKGASLTSDVELSVSGAGFSVSPRTITRAAASSADGAIATITYNPTSTGPATGVLTVTTGSITSRVNLTGSAINTLPAGPVTHLTDCSFVARWSNVGDADSHGEYTLDVMCDGISIDEYPRSVAAADEAFVVEDLLPGITYSYVVKSQHLVSEEIFVTTLEPQPSIDFLFDGRLEFATATGVPSEPAELLVDIENISTAVSVSVTAPFQLSTDKSTWATEATLDPEEDRIYLRLYSDKPGYYRTSIIARAGEYVNDDAEAEGNVLDKVNFIEDFENEDSHMASYNPPQYQGSACLWNFTDAGIWPGRKEAYTGEQGVRMGKESTSVIAMAEARQHGVGVVTFHAKLYSSDPAAVLNLDYSTDGGESWQTAGTAQVTSADWEEYTVTVNATGEVMLRLRQSEGKRLNIDDIEATAYTGLVPDAVADYHCWDAYSRDGRLVIEASTAVEISVCGLDGIVYYSGEADGEMSIDVPAALYIVTAGDFARRVLVK